MRSIEPGISRFPDAQLRIRGLMLAHHPGMTEIINRRELRPLLARHDRAEPVPGFALEALHLQLLDRGEVGRAGLDLRAGQIDADLEVEVRRLLHDVLSREIVAALPQ